MIKKTILGAALALAAINPLLVASAEASAVGTVKTELSDSAITIQVKALYLQSALIKSTAIKVTTKHHNVYLSGKVDTDLQYEAAVSLALSVDSVADVKAHKLIVASSKAPIADTFITAKAQGIIMKEKLFGSKAVEFWPVSFETKDGVLFVTGKVESAEVRANIVKLLTSIKGLKSVNSSITLS